MCYNHALLGCNTCDDNKANDNEGDTCSTVPGYHGEDGNITNDTCSIEAHVDIHVAEFKDPDNDIQTTQYNDFCKVRHFKKLRYVSKYMFWDAVQ